MLKCFKCSIKFEDVYEMLKFVLFAENISVFNVMEVINIIMSNQIMKTYIILLKIKTIRFINHYPFATGILHLKLIMILLWKE